MIWAFVVVFVIIAASMLFTVVVKAILNNALTKMEGYTGHIDKFSIQLFKNKISLENTTMRAVADNGLKLDLPVIIIFFKWRPLFRRILDLNIMVDKPRLNFVAEEPTPAHDQNSSATHEFPNLKHSIEKLISFKVNVEVFEGEIEYTNAHVAPGWDLTIDKLNIKILDVSNRAVLSEVSTIGCTCQLYEGAAELNITLRPLEPTLTLDSNLELKSINLVLLNDIFRMYGKVDINKGTMDLFGEVAVAENAFKGYLKPLIKDLDFISKADRTDNLAQKIWERIVAGLFNVLANNRNHQVATIIPIEGRLDDPHVRAGAAIIGILRNAFIKALSPSLENVIDLKSIWRRARYETQGMIQRIFATHKP